jgi:hypothetical protein
MMKRRRLLRLTRRSAGQYASVLAWQWQDFGGSEVVVFGFGCMLQLFVGFGGTLWWWLNVGLIEVLQWQVCARNAVI